MGRGTRNSFTDKEDKHLIAYIARENPGLANRTGNKLYEKLEENADGKWPWSKNHPWQSWRERYKTHQDDFDKRIRQYQKTYGIEETSPKKRKREDKDDEKSKKQTRVRDDAPRRSVEDEKARRKRLAKLQQADESGQESEDKEEKRGKRSRVEKDAEQHGNARKNRIVRRREDEESSREVAITVVKKAEKMVSRMTDKDYIKVAHRNSGDAEEQRDTLRNPVERPVHESDRLKPASPSKPIKTAPRPMTENVDVDHNDEEYEDDNEAPRSPIGSQDYRGDIFNDNVASEADKAEAEAEAEAENAAEVDAMLTDGEMGYPELEPEPEQSQLPKQELISQHESRMRLYPDLKTLQSPIVPHEDPHIPGSFITLRVTEKVEEDDTLAALQLSQEPTPPISGIDDLPNQVEIRLAKGMRGAPSKSPSKPGINSALRTSQRTSSHPVPQSPSDAQSKPAKVKASDIPLQKPGPPLKRKKPELDDIFGPSPPTPTSEAEPRRHSGGKRGLPILDEGPFNNKFRGTRRPLNDTDTENDSDEMTAAEKPAKVWPPVRRMANGRAIALPWGMAAAVRESAKADTQTRGKEKAAATTEAVNENISLKGKERTGDGTNKGQQQFPTALLKTSEIKSLDSAVLTKKRMGGIEVNAVASTSRTMLPPSKESSTRTLFGVTSSKEVLAALDISNAQVKRKATWKEEVSIPDDSTLIEPEVDSAAKRVAAVLSRNSVGTNSPVSGKAHIQVAQMDTAIQPMRFGASDSRLFKPPPQRSPLSDDPFVESPYKKKGKESGSAQEEPIPHIDLRASRLHHPRISSVSGRGSTSTSRAVSIQPPTTRNGHHSAIYLPPDELQEIQELGLKEMISAISKKHGFTEEVVRNIFNMSGSLKNTESIILDMELHAERAALAWIKQLRGETDEDEEAGEHGDKVKVEAQVPVPVSSSSRSQEAQEAPSARLPSRTSLNGSRRTKTERLQIRPLVQDDQMSDYIPPTTSRAGRYVRLQQQGREEEALEGERRRASLGSSIALRDGESVVEESEPESDGPLSPLIGYASDGQLVDALSSLPPPEPALNERLRSRGPASNTVTSAPSPQPEPELSECDIQMSSPPRPSHVPEADQGHKDDTLEEEERPASLNSSALYLQRARSMSGSTSEAGSATDYSSGSPSQSDGHMRNPFSPLTSSSKSESNGPRIRDSPVHESEHGHEGEALEEEKLASPESSVPRLQQGKSLNDNDDVDSDSYIADSESEEPLQAASSSGSKPGDEHSEPVELTKEQKDMFVNASRENIETLREVEKTVGQNTVFRWFVDHMRGIAAKQGPEN